MPVSRHRIPFTHVHLTGREIDYVRQAIEANHVSGDGEFTRRCHRWLEDTFGCAKALLTHSCTAALEMAAILADVQAGDEVIMPSFTFVSSANAFVLRGAVPVFVDIDSVTLNIDPVRIEEAITPRTRAIVPVHYAGVACEMNEIMALARKHDLLVVEDAAQAILSTYEGKPLGAIGQLAALSFHETKNAISGEGGALLINDPALIERAEVIREKGTNRSKFFRGQVDKYTWVDIGSSYLPSDMIAAFLLAQLEGVVEISAARQRVWDAYHARLEPLETAGRLQRPRPVAGRTANAHMYYILLPSLEVRTRVIEHLDRRGISAVFHYVPLHSSPAGLRFGRTMGELPVTAKISETLLRLPLWPDMTGADIDDVVSALFEAV